MMKSGKDMFDLLTKRNFYACQKIDCSFYLRMQKGKVQGVKRRHSWRSGEA